MYVIFFRLLQTAQGSLLDDEQLVNTLNSSKQTSQEIAEQLQVSEQTEIKIDTAREVRFFDLEFSVYARYKVMSKLVSFHENGAR